MTYYIMKLNSVSKSLMIALALLIGGGLVAPADAQQFAHRPRPQRFAQQGNNAAANTTFNGARDLIDDAQWAKAEKQFGDYLAAYPAQQNRDAAMYWMAYAQYQLKKFDQSKQTIENLLKTYQQSQWKQDAQLLLAQLPGTVSVKVDPVTVTVQPVVGGAPFAVTVQDPVAVPMTPDVQARVAEAKARAQERMAEAQARAEERTRDAQQRVAERMAQIEDKMKDKDFKFDFDYDFDFDGNFPFDYEVGKGKGIGHGQGQDDPNEFKIVVLQALCESDPQRCTAIASDWLKPNSGQTVTQRRAALRLLARHGGKGVTPTILSVAQNETDLKVK